MNHRTFENLFRAQLFIFLILAIAWCGNLYRFTKCDFEPSWKGEIIHGLGIVLPPASLVTVWFSDK